MTEARPPRAFLSYSHADRAIAERFASALRQRGVDVWIDALEILPGDSLVEKIFEEGLKDCRLFVVLLSQRSVRSRWVRHELDVALVNRLKRITRVIPVLVERCEVPVSLRSLRWVDLEGGVENAADSVARAAFAKTPASLVSDAPEFVRRAVAPRAGLSEAAATVAAFIAKSIDVGLHQLPSADGSQIQEGTGLTTELVNDAVDELKANGLLRVRKFLGTAPFEFGIVEPTYALAFTFPDFVQGELSPEQDPRQVAAVVASLGEADGEKISERLGFSPNRVNFSVAYLRDYGLIATRDFLGTAPFNFGVAMATRATRQFVQE